MLVREFDLDVNVEEELEPYLHLLPKNRVRGNKLQSCSPFREENHPSFAVNLDNGTYIDSGNDDDEWKKGNLIKLLSWFREEDYDATIEYLLEKYHIKYSDADQLSLEIHLEAWKSIKTFPLDSLKPFAYHNDYLPNRGISEQVMKAFRLGFDPKNRTIVFPIFNKNGIIVSFKFRKIDNKIFWYDKTGQPIKQHLYGLNWIWKYSCTKVYIVEGETDCLFLWSIGIPAVATFGASLSKMQEKLLACSPAETFVLAGDNDAVGQAFNDNMEKRLFKYGAEIERLVLPSQFKDVNEVYGNPDVEAILRNTKKVSIKGLTGLQM